MHKRDQRNSKTFMDIKKIDLIINSKFIDPNKHKKHTVTTKYMEGFWSIGLGSSQTF